MLDCWKTTALTACTEHYVSSTANHPEAYRKTKAKSVSCRADIEIGAILERGALSVGTSDQFGIRIRVGGRCAILTKETFKDQTMS
jgi:hypothetical protein